MWIEWMKGKRLVEYVSVMLVCLGLWLDAFVKADGLEVRIARMVMMIVGMLGCALYAYANRKQETDAHKQQECQAADAKIGMLTVYSMWGIYGVILSYCAAFKKQDWMMVFVALLFIQVMIYGLLKKKYRKE